jgi:hypothetical protein
MDKDPNKRIDELQRELDELKVLFFKNKFPTTEIWDKDVRFNRGFLAKGTVGFYTKVPIAQYGAITAPTGGATVDAPARTAINDIRTFLTAIGLTQ